MQVASNGHRSVTTWLWEKDYQMLTFLAEKAHTNRSDYLRNLIREHVQTNTAPFEQVISKEDKNETR